MFLAAYASIRHPDSKTFYDRKRAEGKRHNAALICLARRRCSVILAMLRTQPPHRSQHPEEVLAAARQEDRDTPTTTPCSSCSISGSQYHRQVAQRAQARPASTDGRRSSTNSNCSSRSTRPGMNPMTTPRTCTECRHALALRRASPFVGWAPHGLRVDVGTAESVATSISSPVPSGPPTNSPCCPAGPATATIAQNLTMPSAQSNGPWQKPYGSDPFSAHQRQDHMPLDRLRPKHSLPRPRT